MSQSIEHVLKKHTPNLMSIPDVVGTAQGLCEGLTCIKIFVVKMNKQIKEQIPNRIEGYEVKIEITTSFQTL